MLVPVEPVLAFRAVPTTLLALLTYLSIFIALIVTDALPNVPKNQGGLNIKQAYEDLRQIAAHPHPYNSHLNDAVRSYLLSRLIQVGDHYSHVHISDDLVSNGSWAESIYGTYFEGTNILVKIDGTSTNADGILFSAHYDSVSTAPGSTDDGMGVATLLQLVQYFAENRPLRTAVFNINNGEEDWLNGAHAFLEHPWANLTGTFLNLEGAAAGGRPILFRANSINPVHSFQSKHIPHPHANVLSSDGFSRGLIRSDTDFSVYTGIRSSNPGADSALFRSGMQGLDVAFYKGRSRYHTKYDTVPYTSGGEKSLWSMMEVAKGVGIELLNAEDRERDRNEDIPVYFDLFKSIMIVFPITNLLAFNIIILILGPITLVSLAIWKNLVINAGQLGNGHLQTSWVPLFFSRGSGSSNSTGREHHKDSRTDRLIAIWTHSKFWISLVVTLILQALSILLYVVINPFAIYSSPYIVLLFFLSLTYLSLNFVLSLPTSLPFKSPISIHTTSAQEDKRIIFLHLYLLTWVLVLLSTIGITALKPGLGSGYLMSAWNLGVGLACVIAGAADVVAGERDHLLRNGEEYHVADEENYEELEGENSNGDEGAVPEPDESTPLIRHPSQFNSNPQRRRGEKGEVETVAETWWWIPQFIVSVPLPVILFSHVTMIILDAMSQTLSDGSPAAFSYALTSLFALLLVLPLSPYMSKLRLNRAFSIFVLSLFVLSISYTWLTFPFSTEIPLKVFFQQRVEIDLGLHSGNGSSMASHKVNDTHGSHKFITTLIGHPRYLPNSAIISNIPSAQAVDCKSGPTWDGLVICEWESGSGMVPIPGNSADDDETIEYMNASISRTGSSSARITVKGRNTRSCKVYFDNQPIREYIIHRSGDAEENKGMQLGFEVEEEGIKDLRLWSRTWGKEFVVDVKWGDNGTIDFESGLEGRIACGWAEYESARIDHGSGLELENIGSISGKIPAFEELLMFLPEWAVVSKAADGLVEVVTPFSI